MVNRCSDDQTMHSLALISGAAYHTLVSGAFLESSQTDAEDDPRAVGNRYMNTMPFMKGRQ